MRNNLPNIDFELMTYWVLPDKFLAGPKPSSLYSEITDMNLKHIINQGVRVFINLMNPNEYVDDSGELVSYSASLQAIAKEAEIEVEILNFPIEDFSIPTRSEMENIINSIEFQLDNGKTIYVHCWGGLGRTGTVVGCFLKSRGIAGSEDVFEKIAALRVNCSNANKPSPENDLQKNFVIDF